MQSAARLGLVLLSTMVLAGCNARPIHDVVDTSCPAQVRPHELRDVDGLYVLPDDTRDPVIDEIDRASCSIDITIYLISDQATIDALVRAEARGVEVRILQEPAPFGGGGSTIGVAEMLEEHGVELRDGPDEIRFLHAKYLVIDDQVAIITNQNLTRSAFDANREFGVITTMEADVTALATIFGADWNDSALPQPSDRMVLSPTNAREELLSAIAIADTTIRLYAEVIRDDDVIDALSSAAERGVSVRVLVNKPDEDLDEVVYTSLTANGIDVAIATDVYVHAKAMVVDEEIVIVGSHNPTSTSLDENREISLIVSDLTAVQRVVETFDGDWSSSAPFK